MKYITPVARAILSDLLREAQQGDISPIHQSWESIVPLKHRSSDRKATSRLLIYAPNYFSITDDDIFMITLNICSKIFLISRMKYYKSYCIDCLNYPQIRIWSFGVDILLLAT